MLNPLAHDFTPISALSLDTPEINDPSPKRKERRPRKKHTNPDKLKTRSKAESSSLNLVATAKDKQKATKRTQHRDSKSNGHSKSKAAQVLSTTNTSSVVVTTPPADLFATESKFITIEAAIDPIRRINETTHASSIHNRRQSTQSDRHQLEHGYERYIDWIDRSLKLFDTVTLVGMDNAVVDIVSMVTILQDRKLGVHDDIETFSMDTGNNRIVACIQVKLQPFNLLH
ncbi:hypothetical protein [Parasitella parasitica]|uniref:Uncharacterized protein n=1 Tax=Parasitella parasitica TaxID=35722 RepID=A0A0B7N1S6_9FUNG|nr:hypothetical protein [Parasitella parasitica]